MSRVIDTSVIVKWAVKEDGWERASALIGSELVAPDLVRAELANALFKKVARKEITAIQALVSQAETEDSLEFVPVLAMSKRALEIGLELNHPTYDCFFLALAEARRTSVITADVRLHRRCAGTVFAALVEVL